MCRESRHGRQKKIPNLFICACSFSCCFRACLCQPEPFPSLPMPLVSQFHFSSVVLSSIFHAAVVVIIRRRSLEPSTLPPFDPKLHAPNANSPPISRMFREISISLKGNERKIYELFSFDFLVSNAMIDSVHLKCHWTQIKTESFEPSSIAMCVRGNKRCAELANSSVCGNGLSFIGAWIYSCHHFQLPIDSHHIPLHLKLTEMSWHNCTLPTVTHSHTYLSIGNWVARTTRDQPRQKR